MTIPIPTHERAVRDAGDRFQRRSHGDSLRHGCGRRANSSPFAAPAIRALRRCGCGT